LGSPDHRLTARGAAVVLAAIASLAGPAAALAAPAAPAAGDSINAKLIAPGHAPVVGSWWSIKLDVSSGQAKLTGDVNYEFLSAGQVVSRRRGHAFTRGAFHDRLCFPALAEDQPLKLGVIVTTRYGSKTLYWTVTPTKGAVTSPCKTSL
jgi:hypothetical protein